MERYKDFREAQLILNSRIFDYSVDKFGMEILRHCADYIDMMGDVDELIYDKMYLPFLLDFLIYEHMVDGKKIYQLFRDNNMISQLEAEILDSYDNSYLSLFRVVNKSESKNLIFLRDLLEDRKNIRLTDILFSKTLEGNPLLFTRVLPYEGMYITSGMSGIFDDLILIRLVDNFKGFRRDVIKENDIEEKEKMENTFRMIYFLNAYRDIGIDVNYED
jgi:hypothetical protein